MAKKFGKYELVRELGRGGQAVVYEARDTELDWPVALKVLLPGMRSEDGIKRFEREARAASRLTHEGIVRVCDVGEVQGRHYIAMDLVRGGSLDGLIASRRPGIEEAMTLVARVADALHYAHGQGLVHRDIKPANILLDEQGNPKVSDFGFALDAAAHTRLTQSGAVMGTPSYMSPEQARGKAHAADARTDVYSLGAVLYELLTGRPPFRAESALILMQQIAFETPQPPSEIAPVVPADAETICLKCLEKEPDRRYASAKELADDIRRFLKEEPIAARPVSAAYQARRKVARHGSVIVASMLALAAVGGHGAWAYARFSAARDYALQRRGELEELKRSDADGRSEIAKLRGEIEGVGARVEAAAREEAAREEAREQAEAKRLQLETIRRRRAEAPEHKPGDAEVTELRAGARGGTALMTFSGHTDNVFSVAFSPDGRRIASASADKTMKLWDAATGRELMTLKGHTHRVHSVAFSPDGRRIASGSYDMTVKLWDAVTGRELTTFTGHTRIVTSVAFSPDGRRIASGGVDRTVKLWDAETGRELMTLSGYMAIVTSVAFSPDGRRIASGSGDTVKLWEAATGRELMTLKGDRSIRKRRPRKKGRYRSRRAPPVAFSPDGRRIAFSLDGRRIASGSGDDTVKLWDAETGRELMTRKGHTGRVNSVAFSPDGRRIASGSYDKTLKLWDAETGRELMTLKGHTGKVNSVAFSPDGRRIASGSGDKTVKVWNARTMTNGN